MNFRGLQPTPPCYSAANLLENLRSQSVISSLKRVLPYAKDRNRGRKKSGFENLCSPWAENHPRHRPRRALRRTSPAPESAGQAQCQTISHRLSLSTLPARIENLEITKCDPKGRPRRRALSSLRLYRTRRHHGGHRAELRTRHRNERVCRSGFCAYASRHRRQPPYPDQARGTGTPFEES